VVEHRGRLREAAAGGGDQRQAEEAGVADGGRHDQGPGARALDAPRPRRARHQQHQDDVGRDPGDRHQQQSDVELGPGQDQEDEGRQGEVQHHPHQHRPVLAPQHPRAARERAGEDHQQGREGRLGQRPPRLTDARLPRGAYQTR
jgi:hypothetical protein